MNARKHSRNFARDRLIVRTLSSERDRWVYPWNCITWKAATIARARSHGRQCKRASDFLKALAHESRLMILCILAEGEKSVSELEDILNLRQPTVSQQLARLRADGLVSTRRDGKAVYYKSRQPGSAHRDRRDLRGVLQEAAQALAP